MIVSDHFKVISDHFKNIKGEYFKTMIWSKVISKPFKVIRD